MRFSFSGDSVIEGKSCIYSSSWEVEEGWNASLVCAGDLNN